MNEMGMKEFSVCYDKFCIGRFTLTFDKEGRVVPCEGLGAFEMYLLGMWNDGMVVTMKGYDEEREENCFVLLVPDGSEQLMTYSEKEGFTVKHFRNPGEGRFAYLLEFMNGLEYEEGVRGYEEYDEEEGMIFGILNLGEESYTYGGRWMGEVREDFQRLKAERLKAKGELK